MYIARMHYEGCSSFQDENSQGSVQPNSLFNLTQNYYYIVADDIHIIQQTATDESISAKESNPTH